MKIQIISIEILNNAKSMVGLLLLAILGLFC